MFVETDVFCSVWPICSAIDIKRCPKIVSLIGSTCTDIFSSKSLDLCFCNRSIKIQLYSTQAVDSGDTTIVWVSLIIRAGPWIVEPLLIFLRRCVGLLIHFDFSSKNALQSLSGGVSMSVKIDAANCCWGLFSFVVWEVATVRTRMSSTRIALSKEKLDSLLCLSLKAVAKFYESSGLRIIMTVSDPSYFILKKRLCRICSSLKTFLTRLSQLCDASFSKRFFNCACKDKYSAEIGSCISWTTSATARP